MFISLQKKEFQHFVLQYILSNLEQFDELSERANSEEDLFAEAGQWQEEDDIWYYIMNLLKRRNVENRLRQTWPRWEGRVKVLGPVLAQRIIDTRQIGNKSESTVKIAI